MGLDRAPELPYIAAFLADHEDELGRCPGDRPKPVAVPPPAPRPENVIEMPARRFARAEGVVA